MVGIGQLVGHTDPGQPDRYGVAPFLRRSGPVRVIGSIRLAVKFHPLCANAGGEYPIVEAQGGPNEARKRTSAIDAVACTSGGALLDQTHVAAVQPVCVPPLEAVHPIFVQPNAVNHLI